MARGAVDVPEQDPRLLVVVCRWDLAKQMYRATFPIDADERTGPRANLELWRRHFVSCNFPGHCDETCHDIVNHLQDILVLAAQPVDLLVEHCQLLALVYCRVGALQVDSKARPVLDNLFLNLRLNDVNHSQKFPDAPVHVEVKEVDSEEGVVQKLTSGCGSSDGGHRRGLAQLRGSRAVCGGLGLGKSGAGLGTLLAGFLRSRGYAGVADLRHACVAGILCEDGDVQAGDVPPTALQRRPIGGTFPQQAQRGSGAAQEKQQRRSRAEAPRPRRGC
mmetsp:Transcript_23185/g.59043  ORF Transcript_23185/g.59043 Transcript_23185/m.59043 type:complete len:276 (+) Transcript_23185:1416-2243(+)